MRRRRRRASTSRRPWRCRAASRLRGLGGGLLLQLLGPRLGLVRLCGGERLVGVGELGVGAGLEPFQLAQRRRERCCLARRCRGGFLRLVGRLGGLRGLAGERLGRAGAAAMASAFGTNSAGWENSTGARVVRRDDHPHPDPRLVEQLLRKAEGHPHAAVRGRIAGQRPAVQRDAVPGDALHVRHPGIVIHVRAVVLVLLDDGEDAGRRLASLGAGRHRRAQDPAVGVVESDLLGLDRHDRHDRLAGIARRRRLGGWRGARLSRARRRRSAPSVRPSPRASQWREVPNAASPRWIAPSSIDLPCHAPVEMPVRACVDQVSDAVCGPKNRRHYTHSQFASGDIRHVAVTNLSYTTAWAGKSWLKLALFRYRASRGRAGNRFEPDSTCSC